jgi:outer membrane protein assembly factor BamB
VTNRDEGAEYSRKEQRGAKSSENGMTAHKAHPYRDSGGMKVLGTSVLGALVTPMVLLLSGALVPVDTGIPSHSAPRAVLVPQQPAPGDWPAYLHDAARSSSNTADHSLNVTSAANLTLRWKFTTNGTVAASPIVVRGTVFIGSWDGYEYALNASTGAEQWATFIGKSVKSTCMPPALGVTSTATWHQGVVYVGGGDGYWYALNARNGSILWKVFTGNTTKYYNWGSPLIVETRAYIGIASYCDNPLVRGALLKVSLSSHSVLRRFYTVPPGQVGGGIWSSPTYDSHSNSVFVTTGNGQSAGQKLVEAILSLNATTLAVQGSWKVPQNQTGIDSDFGATPTLINGAGGTPLVVATNKNGIAYALARANVSAGPVWSARVAVGGPCPQCGNGSASSGAYANHTLFLAGGNATIGSNSYAGSVRALWPSNGSFRWQYGAAAAIVPAVSYGDGLVVAGVGPTLEALNASSGRPVVNFSTGGVIYGPAAIAHGCIFFGSTDGNVYALGAQGSYCNAKPHGSFGHVTSAVGAMHGARQGVEGSLGGLAPNLLPVRDGRETAFAHAHR